MVEKHIHGPAGVDIRIALRSQKIAFAICRYVEIITIYISSYIIIIYLSSSPTYHHLALGEKQVQSTAAVPYSNRYCVKEIRLLGYSGDSYVGAVLMLSMWDV